MCWPDWLCCCFAAFSGAFLALPTGGCCGVDRAQPYCDDSLPPRLLRPGAAITNATNSVWVVLTADQLEEVIDD